MQCREDNNEDVLCLKIKYNILSYPILCFYYLIFNIVN